MLTRLVTEKDIPAVVDMAREFYACTVYEIPFDDESVALNIQLSMEYDLCFIAESDGEPAGFILGVVSPFLVNRDHFVCAELAWWVLEPFRNSSAAIKLLKSLENGAKEAGCSSLSMMSLENMGPDEVDKIYKKLGYTSAERTHVRKL
tara:strand:- start:3685 stop:4128 length:444 start_codon:yes stop_codon:yes gene_type:complete